MTSFDFDYPTIDKSGITEGLFRISHDDYHDGIGVSSTQLKKFITSPAHSQIPEVDKKCYSFGRAFHMRMIEPELWDDTYIVLPNVYKRSKAEKHYWSLLESAKTGPVTLSDEDELAIVEALKAYTIEVVTRIKSLLKGGMVGKELIDQKEKDLLDRMGKAIEGMETWKEFKEFDGETAGFKIDEATGIMMKLKSDLLGGRRIADIKTTAKSADPKEFLKEAINRKYHYSAGYYTLIMYLITGQVYDFVWIAAEKQEPFGVSFVRCPPELLDLGAKRMQKALAGFGECMQSGVWPCYPDYIVELPAPEWALRN